MWDCRQLPVIGFKDVREPASCYYASLAKCNAAGAQLALIGLSLEIGPSLVVFVSHVTKTNMAEGIQKRLQSEIEKYKGVQKGNEAPVLY